MLDRHLDAHPRAAPAYLARARVLLRLGRDDEAAAALDAALLHGGESAALWCAVAALLQRRHYSDARAACDRALALDPECASAWAQKGAALAAMAMNTQAHECFDRALALDPSHPLATHGRRQLLAEARPSHWWEGDTGLALIELLLAAIHW